MSTESANIIINLVGSVGTFGVVIYLLFHNLAVTKEKDKKNEELVNKFIDLAQNQARREEQTNNLVANNNKALENNTLAYHTLTQQVMEVLRDRKY